MRIVAILGLVSVLLQAVPKPAIAAGAPESLDAATLRRLKEATVWVSVSYGEIFVSGSGFLCYVDEKAGYVATTSEVTGKAGLQGEGVRVTFNGGEAGERTIEGRVVTWDAPNNISILRIPVEKLPAPISWKNSPELRETLPLFALGFPFGDVLATSKKTPAITISRASISALRKNGEGVLEAIQIDGDIHPGSAGGPIVDARGNLVGVAVKKVDGTGIGLAMPSLHIERAFKSYVSHCKLDAFDLRLGTLRIHAQIQVSDPLGNFASISILLLPVSQMPEPPRKLSTGYWGPLPDKAQAFQMDIRLPLVSGDFEMSGVPGQRVEYYYQIKSIAKEGKVSYTAPVTWSLPFPVASPAPEKSAEKPPSSSAPAGTNFPRAQEDNINLKDASRIVKGASITQIKKGDGRINAAVFSPDGKTLYLLEGKTLKAVSMPEFRQIRSVSVDLGAEWIGLSRQGLIVTGYSSISILDEKTLETKGQIAAIVFHPWITACPQSDLLFAVEGRQRKLLYVDLIKRKIEVTFDAPPIRQEDKGRFDRKNWPRIPTEMLYPTLSPDGQFLFSMSAGFLSRHRVGDKTLVHEETGPLVDCTSYNHICISPDGRYVAIRSGKTAPDKNHPLFLEGGFYVYRSNDLSKPVLGLRTGKGLSNVAFDKTRGCIYGGEKTIQIFGTDGKMVDELDLGQACTDSIHVHPDGGKILVYTGKLFWIEFPPPAPPANPIPPSKSP